MTLTPLQEILSQYRTESRTEREKGTYFEELIRTYLRHEPVYADLYSDVWLLSEVPDALGISKKDTQVSGILDAALEKFQSSYEKTRSITKEDLFYYMYGLLHSEDYRTR